MSDHRGVYLIPKRSEARGLVGIGFLAVALITGGGPQSFTFAPLTATFQTTHLEAAAPGPLLQVLEPVQPVQAEPIAVPVSPVFEGLATHYGVSYNGSRMGCAGDPYSSDNETIIAVAPMQSADWPCGTPLRVCGAAGCIIGFRQDSCPGCGSYHIDLSEAGIARACGDQADVCRVAIEQVSFEYPAAPLPPPIEVLTPEPESVQYILVLDLEPPTVPSLISAGAEPAD